MRSKSLPAILVLFLFVAPLLMTSCAKSGCPASQELYQESTMGISNKQAKQVVKQQAKKSKQSKGSKSGITPPSKKKRR